MSDEDDEDAAEPLRLADLNRSAARWQRLGATTEVERVMLLRVLNCCSVYPDDHVRDALRAEAYNEPPPDDGLAQFIYDELVEACAGEPAGNMHDRAMRSLETAIADLRVLCDAIGEDLSNLCHENSNRTN